ncbi:hypothetical protein CDD81_757 [Ophiocordyceps australis]|uniref:Vps72/YL1 C-terminal domain-containing protein n=1 Tax=Ophiocordyceps australis TaxID=1399860 RepID=A0A2C5Y159_9HYPO|nr:hypothetical protein CDD81_757 [Ophiocordyceps australis]
MEPDPRTKHDGAHVSQAPLPGSDESDSSSSSASTCTSASDAPAQTQWLATTRSKRSTAGNRIQALLANEDPDSDLELLFAEDEDDEGFSDADDGASDLHMDSSSDEDEDDDNDHDALDGERDLQRQARDARRASHSKRKAQQAALPARFRKRVRISAATPTTTTPSSCSTRLPTKKKKKKSDRASWLPDPADLPTRASARDTTRASKQQLHLQMAQREARRLRQLALQESKAARLEAERKPPMTQAQRLAEAAVVERRNAKSLNRWQEAEKQRDEERRAKLAALNNRTLKGPVITFWSGVREWKDALGQHVTLVETKPKKKRERGAKQKASESEPRSHDGTGTATTQSPPSKPQEGEPQASSTCTPPAPPTTSPPPPARPSGFLAAPTLAPPPPRPPPTDSFAPLPPPPAAFKSNVLAPPATSPPPAAAAPLFNEFRFQLIPLDPAPETGTPLDGSNTPPLPPPPSPATDKTPRTTARNAIIYQNFDTHALRDKTVQTQILFGRKMSRLAKPPASPTCAITNLPARYRDPLTGLAYRNAAAYAQIQRLRRGEYSWSRLLGAWVGTASCAARGVPARFLHPEPEEVRKRRAEEKLQARGQVDAAPSAHALVPPPASASPAQQDESVSMEKTVLAPPPMTTTTTQRPDEQHDAPPDTNAPPAMPPLQTAAQLPDSAPQDAQQPAAPPRSAQAPEIP